ncbi:MAG: hypothetical protein PHR61_03475 [Candidatus Absconditabacteria bacterium]|nr:hypothetical protein [Candidatus Absconditabacteria bacterium]
MTSFLGKFIKYLLWILLFSLLGAFLFGLIRFKGNFVEYIQYLNSIGVEEIIHLDNESQTGEIQEETLEKDILEEELSGLLEDDYFLPEASPLEESDDTSFGFSGSLDNQENEIGEESVAPSVSKEDLVNLIKSREE